MNHSSMSLQRCFSSPIHSIALAALLSGCALFEDDIPPELADVEVVSPEEYYRNNPDFFRFASPEDLPQGLNWQDGMDQPVFASQDAIRGGELRSFIRNFPPTIRLVGPDSNHGFRSVLLDDNSIGLVDRHPETMNFYAALAEKWAVSEDQQTLYFRLRDNIAFSDGEPITVDDFFYLFYFMQSPFIQAPWYNDFYSREYSGITRYDDRTMAIHLSVAKPEPLEFSGLRPVPAHFHDTLGPTWITDNQWRFEPTTGPYVLDIDNIRMGRRIDMVRLDDWWGDQHKFYKNRYNPDRKSFVLMRDLNLAFEHFKRGDFDMFNLSLPEYWYDKTEGEGVFERGLIQRAVFYNQVPRANIGLYINSTQGYLSDINIRKGIHHAIDFQRVIDRHFRGDYQRMNTSADGYEEFTHPDLQARPFSVQKAREYFAEAGFTEQGSDGILRNSRGDRLSFTVSFREGPDREVMQILREEARKAGLDLTLLSLEGTSHYQQIMEKQHQITLSGWGISLPYPRYWEFFHTDNANRPQTNNITNFSDAQMDEWIDRYRESTDLEEMMDLAHKMEEKLYEEAVFVPGYKVTFYRVGFWNWIRFPEKFDVRISQSPGQYGLYWIDEQLKSKILNERRGTLSYPSDIQIYDQWKEE